MQHIDKAIFFIEHSGGIVFKDLSQTEINAIIEFATWLDEDAETHLQQKI